MKKLIVLFLLISNILPAIAQDKDKKADEILKATSSKYKAYTSVEADFSIVIESPDKKSKDTHKGTLYSKGNKYKLVMNNQEIISDGKTVWTYLKEANEVQVNDVSTKEDAVTPSNVFTMYEKGFRSKFIEEKTEAGKTFQIVELIPESNNKKFFKIRLKINKADKSISESKVFNRDGSTMYYSITRFVPNPALDESMFTFNKAKYPKAEVVDLR